MMVDDKKQTIRDIIEKVIIHDAGEVEVICLLPVMKEKLEHELKYRNSRVAKCGEVNLV